jgi:hypothetical protein
VLELSFHNPCPNITSVKGAMGRYGETANGRGSASAMKWQYRIAQGFYEAELVNSALQKSIS